MWKCCLSSCDSWISCCDDHGSLGCVFTLNQKSFLLFLDDRLPDLFLYFNLCYIPHLVHFFFGCLENYGKPTSLFASLVSSSLLPYSSLQIFVSTRIVWWDHVFNLTSLNLISAKFLSTCFGSLARIWIIKYFSSTIPFLSTFWFLKMCLDWAFYLPFSREN